MSNKKDPTASLKSIEDGTDASFVTSDLSHELKAAQTTVHSLKYALMAAGVLSAGLLAAVVGLGLSLASISNDSNSNMGAAAASLSHKKFATSFNDATGAQCLDAISFGEMLQGVVDGKDAVALEMRDDTMVDLETLSGLKATGGLVCFSTASGKELCAEPSSTDCVMEDTPEDYYVATCLDVYSRLSYMPSLFEAMVADAFECIQEKCSDEDDIECACECAETAGVELAWSFGTSIVASTKVWSWSST